MAVTIEDIVSLTKAGFTAQQIAGMLQAPTPEAPASSSPAPGLLVSPAQVSQVPSVPAPAQPEAPAPAPAPAAGTDQILEAIKQLSGNIMAQNINNTQQPAQQSVESILAEIINPPTK